MLKLKGLVWNVLLFVFGVLASFQVNAQKDLVISGGNTVSSFVCENRTAYVWGSNTGGQLGVGSGAASISVPTAVPIPGNPDVKQINSGSGAHFVALTCGGDVWAWGANDNGQVGTGASSGMNGVITIPTRVLANAGIPTTHRNASGQLINASVVYSGTSNSFAILNNGRLVSWGLNSGGSAGQLGQGTTTDAYTANYVLTGPGTPLTGVTQIFAGDNVAYALVDPDGDGVGTVYSWGNGLNGTLGRNAAGTGNPSTVTTPSAGTVQDSYARPVYYMDGTQMNNIQQLQAGDVFGIALDVNGYIWTWGNGGWNNSTGNTTNSVTSSGPARVIAGTTTGASNDGTYLLAKAIGGGQGYGMAVTIDGKPVAWGGGGCGNGGATGNGTLTGSAAGPGYILYGAGQVHNNVTLINRGDLWGFYGTSDNEFYAWGCNNVGQLGIGNTTNQAYATKITPPGGCDFRDPAPFANLDKDDVTVCQSTFTSLVLNSGFTVLASIASKYTVTWYKNGTAPANIVKTGPASVATNLSYTATTNGTYRVEIQYTGANAGCVVYDVAFDEMTISYYLPSFTVPTNLTFCGATASVHVNSTTATTNPIYAWYPTMASTTELGRTVGSGSTTISTTTLAGTTTKTVYVEEIKQKTGSVFANAQALSTLVDGSGMQDHDTYIETTTTLSLDSLVVFLRSYSGTATFTGRVQVYGNKSACGGKTVADKANVLYQSAVFNISTTSTTFVPKTIPVGITLPPGKYFIGYSAAPTGGTTAKLTNVAGMGNSGSVLTNNTAISDNIGGTYVKFYGSDEGDCFGSSGYAGYTANMQFSIPQGYCNRLPVTLTEACPCSKPTSVTITTPASTPVTLCQGTAQNLIGSVTVPSAAQNTAFTYSWRKVLPTPVTTPVAPTVIAILALTATPTPAFALTGAVSDAGTYTLRVEDGNTGNASCYTEASVVVVVNATTVAGVIAAPQTICTGGDPAAFTVTTPASGGNGTTYAYVWEKSINGAAYADIAPAATGATFDEGVLTNATTTPITIDYRRKVTSGVCPQVTSAAVRITVNPAVVAGVVAGDQTICNAGDPVAFTQTTGATGGSGTYTYVWQSSTTSSTTGFTNITPAATNATYDPPAGITTTTYYRRVDGSGTCTTANTNSITVTVPIAVIPGAIAADQTICYNTAPVAFTGTAATGGNGTFAYQWKSSTTGLAGSYTNIALATNATYTDVTLLTADKYYVREVTSGAIPPCNVATTTAIHITVSPNFVVGSIGGTQTVCQTGNPAILTSTTLPTGGKIAYTYQWKSSATAGGPYTNIALATNATYDPPAGIAATTYFIREDKSAGGCGTFITNEVTVTVTPTVVPGVTIATPSTTICNGTSVTFTATPVNGGTPTYVWRKNGTAITPAATGSTYTTTTAANGDSYDVIMTSTAACASPATATSNAIVMTVTTVVTPAVSITAAPGNTICAGTSVTFTASPGNGGSAPTYQWFINNIPQGAATTTAITFTSTTLATGDQIKVIMTSNSGCVIAPGTATSNVITMTVNPVLVPAVAITVSPTGAICPGTSITFTAAPTNGGTPTYVWRKNGTPISPAATGATYTTTTAANGDSYDVVMTSTATCATPATATSNAIAITVTPVPTLAVSIVSDVTSICANNPVQFTATASGTGSTPAPTYEWFVTSAATATGGTSQGVASTTATTFTTSALTAANNRVYVQVVSNAACAATTPVASNVIAITVNAGIGAGTIGSDQTICYNGTPVSITETAVPTATAGSLSYVWQETATPTVALSWQTATTGAPVNGGKDFTASGTFTQDMYYRRIVTDAGTPAPCNVATSNTVHITVRPQLVAGVIGSDQTICSGSVPAVMTETTAPTGGTGTFTYQWQSDASGPFQNISGATNSSYTSTALTTTTRFQRIETSGTCGSVTSNIVTKTISAPEVVTVSINDPGQVCDGSAAFAFVATAATTGTGTLSYAWTLNNGAVGTNSANYSYTPVIGDDNKTVKVVVTTSNGCNSGPATSNPVTLDIVGAATPTVTITTNNNPNCAGLISTFTATSTGGGSNPTYQWYVDPVGPTGPVAVGTGGTTYSTSTLANGDQVYVELTSNLGCLIGTNPFASNKITMVIKPIPAPAITEGDQTICTPNSFTFHGIVTAGNAYEWRDLSSNTVVGTSPDFPASQSGTYVLFEDNGTCNSTSQPVTLNVIQTPVANAGSDIYIREGDAGSLNGSGGAVYSWSPSTYLNNAGVSNPGFTATETITYTLTVSDASNTCSTTDNVTVTVVSPIVVPNIITVNGDGSNDDWYLKNIEGYPNCIIEIYNRWGNLVWKSEGYPKNWDGTNFRNGQVLPDGTYFYIINLQSQIYDEPLTGWVQIVK